MVIATDTSFLFSLYGADCHTSVAKAWSSSNNSPIHIHVLARFELLNSFRFAECRKFVPPGTTLNYSASFEIDASKRLLRETHVNFSDLFAEALRISESRTLAGGHRSFDILHVAAAKIIDATHFLTFDANQKELAESEDLIVPF